ncbi:hypothetical protein FRC01_001624 [Tulasnella sp. 417]|nr:hypothetical protein FRC01_001624 [Tulasnella sp. 417]
MVLSKEKSLWITLLGRLQDELPGLCCAIPYHTFGAAKLERLVVRRVRLERNWSNELPSCSKPPKVFRLEEGFVRYLVPGGRWLLSGLFDGSGRLVYTDLQSPSSGPFDLLRHPDPTFRGDAQRIALCLVTDPDVSAFTIAVTYWPSAQLNTPINPRWQEKASCAVWDVKIGESGVLDTSQRSLFPLLYPEDFGFESFVMNRDLLLRGTNDNYARVFEVFDYLNCSNDQLRRGLVVVPLDESSRVRGLRIMPHNQFLVVCSGSLQLFNMPELSDVPVTSLHPPHGLEHPLWAYDFKPCIPRCQPAITPPHLAFRESRESSFGLLIQADRIFLYVSFPPEASNLLDVFEVEMEHKVGWITALVGSHSGFWFDRRTERLLPYLTSFEIPGGCSVVRELAGASQRFSRSGSGRPESLSFHTVPYDVLREDTSIRNFSCFDEASGRILIPMRKPYIAFMILDLS